MIMRLREIFAPVSAEQLNEGPLGKALGATALAGIAGLAGNGLDHLSKLNDIGNVQQSQTQHVAQAPAKPQVDTRTVQAQPKAQPQQPTADPKPSNNYVPLTSSKNELILARVALEHGITGVELAAFMAQMAHESMNFVDMVENNPNVDRYLANTSLGNKTRNDAERFIGRGFIQLTGRWNYTYMQKKLGIDLTSTWSNAHKAANPKTAALIAVTYWKNRVQPQVNDFTDVAQVTKPINANLNGLDDRQDKFDAIINNMGIDV